MRNSRTEYNPFNSVIQEYLCRTLANLTPHQYRLLSDSEKASIYSKGKIVSFVRKKNVFPVLSILTKIGLNWGIYIVDPEFDLDEFADMVKDKDFISHMTGIKNALHTKRSFVTNSKFFAHLQNLIANSLHGIEAIWDRRFIKVSDRISKKVKDNFDNYNILHPEVEFKKASDGGTILLDLFRHLHKITEYCNQHGLTSADFILLSEMYYNAEKWYSKSDITQKFNVKYATRLKHLHDTGYITDHFKTYNITTKGVLFVGEIMSKMLDNVYLE